MELGSREEMLAAVGSRQLDAAALRRIGEKYGVDAIFIGNIAYSQPKTDVRVTDATKLEGGMRIEVRGDISGRAGRDPHRRQRLEQLGLGAQAARQRERVGRPWRERLDAQVQSA